jgi:hypothetical protein
MSEIFIIDKAALIWLFSLDYIDIMFLIIDCLCKIDYKMIFLGSTMDLFPNEQNFDLDKPRERFYHNLKEHHKISNIPKFRCKML